MRFLTDLSILSQDQPLAIYGSGKQGLAFKHYLDRYRPETRVACFVDSFTRGQKDGLPVLHVDDLAGMKEPVRVVVASVFYAAIVQELEGRGVRDALVLHPAVNPGQCFWEEELGDLGPELAAAEAVFLRPEDRDLFRRVVALRTVTLEMFNVLAMGQEQALPGCAGGLEMTPWPPHGHVYLDFFEDLRFRTIIEGGTFDGTNSLDFLERLTPDGHLFAFEPFPRFLHEGPHAARLAADPRFTLVHGGLWETDGESWLWVDGEASRVEGPSGQDGASGRQEQSGGAGLVPVPLFSVDGFVRKQGLASLDLLKLDVENAELPVLRGAAQSLARFRPCLAVCLYHSKFDLFQIPLHLARTLPGYRFRLGHYSTGILDTVLYGLPQERFPG